MGGGVTISKDTFYIPGLTESGGTFRLWPGFLVSSAFVAAGGHEWSITYYPDSLYEHDSFDLCLRLESEGARVTISSAVGLVDPTGTLLPLNLVPLSPPFDFDSLNDGGTRRLTHWVPKKFITQTLHQTYGQGCGGLMFEWTITVLPEPVPEPMPVPVPKVMPVPMPMLEQLIPKPKLKIVTDDVASTPNNAPATTADVAPPLAKVLPTTDVTFSVGGELFHAHKAILCMRSPVFMSPVFKAQLYGGMMESTAEIIEVEDVLPDVFEALLRYIYTDALPDDDDDDEVDEDVTLLISHLLVASDRYGIERLKILCQCKLCDLVSPHNWVKMLVFAEEQRCDRLKDACIQFMATSGRAGKVVVSEEYAQLRRTHPLILIDVLEKINEFRENMLNPCFREMKV
ncbi:hypothetical protein HU200_061172 [Digitaria exilis]|uniref:BTB domain-containing protein n=1 Tax=Digitaria exilis TaxID=1010633 RepID=A0A835AHV1_9POAL|nr:hypothetical protein HU200_061172 [Digitaria exilis]